MGILGGILLTVLAPAIIGKIQDGVFKIIITLLIPFIGYSFISEAFGIFLLGVCLPFGIGSPMTEKDYMNASSFRKDFGKLFDFIGIILIIVSVVMFIFS